MSVDKFGRFDRGLLGSTFPTTTSGDLDVKERFIRNVKDPVLPSDAATKGYVLKNIIPQNLEGNYDFKNRIIKNVGKSAGLQDAATVGFVTDNFLSLSKVNNHYDAKQKSIRNVAYPLLPTDAVNMLYVQTFSLGRTLDMHYTVKNKCIRDLRDPILSSDAATMGYVHKLSLKRTHPDNNIDLEGKLLRNLGNPVLPTDAVNMEYFSKHTPQVFDTHWMFDNKRLSNVQDPSYDGEVVNLRTLNSLALIKRVEEDNNYDAKGFRIVNVRDCKMDGDVVTFRVLKRYVDKWITKHESQVEKLGTAIFDYIHRQSGRSAEVGITGKNFVNWGEILERTILEEEEQEEQNDDEEEDNSKRKKRI